MTSKDGVADPRKVIERIRTEDYLLDIEQESDRVRRGARSLHKKLNSALDLYPRTCTRRSRTSSWNSFKTLMTTNTSRAVFHS